MITELKQEYRNKINTLKSGLIDKNASLNNKIGLIGSDAERLTMIKKLLKEYKEDVRFYIKMNDKEYNKY
jgi:hypothetical protein